MRNPTSVWLNLSDKRINELLRQLEICSLKGTSDGSIDLREVIRIIRGAREEIKCLSRRVERLEIELENEKNKK